MSRQLEQKREQRETKRRDSLIRALEYSLVGAIESQGATMLGFTMRYESFDCLMVIRADFEGKRRIACIGSDSIINCLLKADADASRVGLKWIPDRYHPD